MTPVSQGRISIVDIAAAHGTTRQRVHKLAKRLGIEATKAKSVNSRGQRISYVNWADYERMKPHLAASSSGPTDLDDITSSVFYLIALEPDFDPGRFKVGFTSDITERVRHHRTSAPLAKVVRTWGCRPLWEKTAIECITQDGCEPLSPEVFRTDDLQSVIARADAFFALMPQVSEE